MKKEEKKILGWEARGNLNNSGDFHSSFTLDELEEMLLVENGGGKKETWERRATCGGGLSAVFSWVKVALELPPPPWEHSTLAPVTGFLP